RWHPAGRISLAERHRARPWRGLQCLPAWRDPAAPCPSPAATACRFRPATGPGATGSAGTGHIPASRCRCDPTP
ncbi:MAG: hypothetical protein ACK55Z_22410, partial [bacterium]